MSLLKIIYKLIFFLLLVVLLFLGESFLRLYLLLLFVIFLFTIYKFTPLVKNKGRTFIIVNVLWIIFFLLLLVSSIFTISIPLSLNGLVYYLFSFNIFIFFITRKFIDFRNEYDLAGIFGVTLTLIFISFVSLVFPNLSFSIPGMNLIHANFGHNHLASWLILVFPLSLAVFLRYKNKLLILLPLIISFAVLFSFSRVAIFLIFIQMVLFLFFLVKNKKKKVFLIILSVVFIIVGSFSIYLSIFTSDSNFICPLPNYRKQLCKPFSEEGRLFYWQQSLYVLKENILVGSGVGTFGLASKKYIQQAGVGTNYAHNIFLHLFAESGLLGGGSFLILMIYLWILSYKQVKNNKNIIDVSLFLGLTASYFDALLDFDWHFSGVFITTLLFLAILIRKQIENDEKFIKSYKYQLIKFIDFFKKATLNIIFIVCLLFVFVDLLTRFNKSIFVFDYFPYFHWHSNIFAEKIDNDDSFRRNKLYDIYRNHEDVISILLINENNPIKQIQYKEQISYLSPLHEFSLENIGFYIEMGRVDLAKKHIDEILKFIDVKRQFNSFINYDYYLEILDAVLDLADVMYLQRQYGDAGNYYSIAQNYDKWVLERHKPIFLEIIPSIEQLSFTSKLKGVEGKFFGQYQEEYASFYSKLVFLLLEKHEFDYVPDLTNQTIKTVERYQWHLWDDVLLEVNDLIKEDKNSINTYNLIVNITRSSESSIKYWDYNLRQDIILSLQRFILYKLSNNDFVEVEEYINTMILLSEKDYWIDTQMGNYYLLHGNYKKALVEFQLCLEKHEYNHPNCSEGKEKSLRFESDKIKYYQVSDIILGNKQWQDFAE